MLFCKRFTKFVVIVSEYFLFGDHANIFRSRQSPATFSADDGGVTVANKFTARGRKTFSSGSVTYGSAQGVQARG